MSEITDTSLYRFDGENLVTEGVPSVEAPALAAFAHQQFRSLVLSHHFPCVGAKSAFKSLNYRFGMYGRLNQMETAVAIGEDLVHFIVEQPTMVGPFSTFVASFDNDRALDEETFEGLLWKLLQNLHSMDSTDWDPDVASDPNDPDFEFSYGGQSFFIVGLHPGASRYSRRFAWPTLVFNPHHQFESLRRTGKFGSFQRTVRDRDVALQGCINPSLNDFGTGSGAAQYSGATHAEGWQCPFHFSHG